MQSSNKVDSSFIAAWQGQQVNNLMSEIIFREISLLSAIK